MSKVASHAPDAKGLIQGGTTARPGHSKWLAAVGLLSLGCGSAFHELDSSEDFDAPVDTDNRVTHPPPRSECPVNQFEVKAATAIADQVCAPVHVCAPEELELQAPSATTDRICGSNLCESMDAELQRAVRDSLGIGDTVELSTEATATRSLHLRGLGSEVDLSGLSCFANLEELSIARSLITSLESMPKLPNLRLLSLSNESLSLRLDSTQKLPNLEALYHPETQP